MLSKKVLVPVLIVAVLGVGAVFKVSLVQASTANRNSGLIQYLSQKLGIDQTKVQTVVDDYHTQRQAERQKEMTESYTTYLDGLVKEGKITESQKTTLLAKHAEIQKTREATDWTGKTPQERRTQMENDRTSLETWAKQQGIDVSYLHFGLGKGFGGRGGRGEMMEDR